MMQQTPLFRNFRESFAHIFVLSWKQFYLNKRGTRSEQEKKQGENMKSRMEFHIFEAREQMHYRA